MSASREKKQRQDLLSQGPTQKQLKEQKEARAQRTKTILYTIIGVVVALAVIALLVWHSGFFQRRTTAATVGDVKLSVAEMQFYYHSVRQNELYQQQLYSAYGMTVLSDPYQMYDSSSELGDDQIYSTETNQTYAQHFEENALKSARQVVSLVAAAKAENYSLSSDGKQQVTDEMDKLKTSATANNYPNVGSLLSRNYGSYVTESVYKAILSDQILAGEYQTHYQESLSYDAEDYDAYARENPANVNSYNYRYAYIPGTPETKTDDEGNTIAATDEEKTAAMEAAKAKADALVSGVKAASGDKSEAFNTLVKDAVAETSSYADPDNNLQSGVLGSNLTSSSYYDWLTDSARVKGDITSVEVSGSGYWVVLFLDRYLNNADTVDVRHILIKAELTPADEEAGTPAATEPTAEQMQVARDEAQKLLDEFNAGDKTEDSFAALAKEHSDDTGSASNGGLYTYVEEDTMVPTFNDWIFDASRQSGDTGLVENENAGQYGWHVMYFVGRNGPKWHEIADQSLLNDDMTAWIERVQEPYEAVATGGMSMVH